MRRASLAQAGASDAGVLEQMEQHRTAFEDLRVDSAALKMPRLQVWVRVWAGVCWAGGTCAVPVMRLQEDAREHARTHARCLCHDLCRCFRGD